MGNQIIVSNICRMANEDDVKAVLQVVGTAVAVKFEAGDMRLGTISATVDMDCDASANAAVARLNGAAFFNYPMQICLAERGAARGGGGAARHGATTYGR